MQQDNPYLISISQANPGETPIYRHPDAKDSYIQPKTKNMQLQMLQSMDQFPENKTLGTYNEDIQAYEHITYAQIKELTQKLGSGLLSLGTIKEVQDEQGIKIKPVGIYLKNRREWTLIDVACQLFGLTSCPFYDTLGTESIMYAINLTNVSVCFAQSNTAKVLAQANLPECLKTVVLVENIDEDSLLKLKDKNLQILNWNELLERGLASISPYPEVSENDVLTVLFTSGSTGLPKAAVQTHKNIVGMLICFSHDKKFEFKSDDVYLSYLPLGHTYERMVHLGAFTNGAQINFATGNIATIAQDIQRCKPTYFCSVPRLYNRFYEGIQQKLSLLPPEQKEKFDQAYKAKREYYLKTGRATHEQLDVAFAQTKLILGGRQRIMITGSAPTSEQVLEFLRITLCCQMLEAYGATETLAPNFSVELYETRCGIIGYPTVAQEYKLIDVPDMNYLSVDTTNGEATPRGELCIRGPPVIPGYFKSPQQTQEQFDKDGFYHTGDIAMILPNGSLKLIDRKKNVFKLSQGEFVAPAKVEHVYSRVPGILEVLVLGDGFQNYCVGIIVPDPKFLKDKAAELQIQGNHEDLCNNKDLRSYFVQECFKQGQMEKLNGFEQIKNVHLEPKLFGQVGILTETQKMQRHLAQAHYKNVIQQLYDELNA